MGMSSGQVAVEVLFGWEGNRRSGITPAMRQTVWYIRLRAERPYKVGR